MPTHGVEVASAELARRPELAGMAAGSGMSSGLSGMGGMGGMSGMGMSMGADPWSTPAPQQQQNQSQGNGGFGGVSAAQAKKAEHDPFANIWQ